MVSLARLTGTWGHLPRPFVWAHGYVQVFGFVALFVMGFAFHAVPRFVGAPLAYPRSVPFALWLQTAGVLCVAGAFLLPVPGEWVKGLWTLGGPSSLVAAALFATSLAATIRARDGRGQAFEPWVLAGSTWLVLGAGYWPEVWPFLALSGPPAVAALTLFALNLLMAIRNSGQGLVAPRREVLRLPLTSPPR